MGMKYGAIGAFAGLVFALLIVFVAARWNGTHMPKAVLIDGRGQ